MNVFLFIFLSSPIWFFLTLVLLRKLFGMDDNDRDD